jgi:hypothetical protein
MAKSSKQKSKPGKQTLESLRKRLGPFLMNNGQQSSVEPTDYPTQGVMVKSPWGDKSIILFLPPKSDALIEALNNLHLPERFTGIWHLDTKEFEIIFTVYPNQVVADRSFQVKHRDRIFECGFKNSSARLLLLAEHYFSVSNTTSNYRNLNPFSDYVMSERGVPGFHKIPNARPLSFWIKGIPEWNTDEVLDLATHLNFYMAYYDTQSPQIWIHSTSAEELAMQPETRFRQGRFPSLITTNPIEENLLSFWQAAMEGDPIQAFLNNYLILEFSAFSYVSDDVKRSVRKCLAAPNAIDNFDVLTEHILEAVSADKLDANQKIERLLVRCVNPELVWRELENNRDFFCDQIKFDGGMILEPLLTKGLTLKEFSAHFATTFGGTIRQIRNALSHGKEQRSLATITPTTANFARLQPWVPPIAVAAREVMVYKRALA